MTSPSFVLRTHSAIAEIPQAEWEALSAGAPPFLSYAWLHALERTGCAHPTRGWLPSHLALYRDHELVALAPAYIKGNSEGEFVFDHSWARYAYENLNVEYYPKLIVAVPFTPATASRILMRPSLSRAEVYSAFAQGLRELSERMDISGAHVLFVPPEDAEDLSALGFLHRYGIQFHWRNANYQNFDDFLGRFNSKRRNQIKRERRAMAEAKIELCTFTGRDLTPEIADFIHSFYRSTVDKYFYGRRYLNREFFEEVCASMGNSLHVVAARDRQSKRLIAGAFNLLGEHALYGRYWGAIEDRPFVHFNVCFYAGIDACIERRLELFEPGAGGEHKLSRGFEPQLTHSLHHLRHRALDAVVRDFLKRERTAIAAHVEELTDESGLKPL